MEILWHDNGKLYLLLYRLKWETTRHGMGIYMTMVWHGMAWKGMAMTWHGNEM
jgi:hypothetical protein